jgi:Family of unknown function (DUF6286)
VRVLNRLLGLLLSLVLMAAGAIGLVEIVAAAGGSHDVVVPYRRWWQSVLDAHWNTGWVTLAALICIVAGVALLAVQLVHRRSRELALRERRPGVSVAVERRALERSLGAAVDEIDGVGHSRIRVRRQRAAVAIRADELVEPGLEQRVTTVAQKRLDELDLAQPPTLAVRLSSKGASS